MTVTATRTTPTEQSQDYRPLPSWAPIAVLAGAAVVAALLMLVVGTGLIRFLLMTVVLYLVVLVVLSRQREGGRRAVDRFVTGVVTSSFVFAVIPLISLIYTVIHLGLARFDASFFTDDMTLVVGAGGGGKAAIVGTIIITGLTTLISAPIGVLAAVYLVEYGGKGRLARLLTLLVDVMTGIPSIVAGLFAYALFELILEPNIRLGLGGAVALSVLMIPVVVRSSEEMLKLVPAELREASYALGVPKWRTILKVVLPAAAAGLATGVFISISRIIGETAPLLLIASLQDKTNWNPLSGRMTTLPVYAYNNFFFPGVSGAGVSRAWTAALVLMIIVVLLNVVARLVASRFAPKGAR